MQSPLNNISISIAHSCINFKPSLDRGRRIKNKISESLTKRTLWRSRIVGVIIYGDSKTGTPGYIVLSEIRVIQYYSMGRGATSGNNPEKRGITGFIGS